MTMRVEFENKAEYLYAVVAGDFEIREAMDCNDRILDHCSEQKYKKILVDFRQVRGTITDTERIHYAQHGAEKYYSLVESGSLSSCRFVWLGKVPQLDPKRLGEAVIVNRGLMLRATDDVTHAFEWLGVKQDIE